MARHLITHFREKQLSGPLTVAGEQGDGVVLLDPAQLGLQVTGGGGGASLSSFEHFCFHSWLWWFLWILLFVMYVCVFYVEFCDFKSLGE